jgi:AbrB family looped-hinge helix DNA binding protein
MTDRLVEYLSTTRLGERGTMTLPKEYRDELQLAPGAPVTVLRIGNGLLLLPEQERFEQLCESFASRLESAGITEAALQATLPQTRRQLMERRYPKLFAAAKAVKGKPAKSGKARPVRGRKQ